VSELSACNQNSGKNMKNENIFWKKARERLYHKITEQINKKGFAVVTKERYKISQFFSERTFLKRVELAYYTPSNII
jgi:hypothetical protein